MTRPAIERFKEKVFCSENETCWIWTGYINPGGYGRFQSETTRGMMAHRFAYEHFIGTIPEHLQLDHLCRVRCCVNPLHLEPVTAKENIIRGVGPILIRAKQLAKTHCKYGHAFTTENTYVWKGNGHRGCKQCNTLATQKRRASNRKLLMGF